jgi:hypothetical protein
MPYLRRSSRHKVRFPVSIESPAKPGRIGVVRNVSEWGALLGTPSRYRPGQRVRLRYRAKVDGPQLELLGTVVRTTLDLEGDWLMRLVAVRFDRAVAARRLRELTLAYSPH